jgi:biopolymer transport protein ExbD
VTQTKPENIVIAVDTQENIYFNNAPIQVNELRDRLLAKLKAVTNGVYPEVHIRADRAVRFEAVGRVILACQQAGVQKVGFLTEPRNEE